ncbi:hypothetical protein [Kitasatospora terrestris]|uniref:NAD(+)--protein-arginine ADP-ribosyltransferase n=1 Tax=Kitasatospora terrestris TaxID=258051 RepID=A0ABP9EKI8_9ACTN
MSAFRSGSATGDAPQPDPPRRRFGRRRRAAAALPAGTGPASEVVRPEPAGPAHRSELRELGSHVVIAPAAANFDDLWAAVGVLRPIPGSLVVVAADDDAAPVLRDRMGELGGLARARGATVLVLAASGLAALAPNGRRPAEVVAARAGVPVIAPDGLVEITPDGDLDVLAPDGASGPASWWYCAPDATPRRARRAARVPTAVPALRSAVPPTVRVRTLPAGYWLTHVAAPAPGPLPGLAMAAGPLGSTVLVVGTPAAPVLLPEDFVAAVTALPALPDRLVVSAPWAAPDELTALTAALTTRLDRPVHASIGVPMAGKTGPTSRILDAQGHPRWEPFLRQLSAVPGDAVSPVAWHNGGADWRTERPAVFSAFPHWALEAVPAGLWLRPEPPHVLTPRFRRPEAARPLLIVGERDRPVAPDVFEELGCLLDRLPAVGVHGFGLLVHGLLEPAAAPVARFLARTHDLDWLGPEQPVGAAPHPAPVRYGAVAPPPPPVPHHQRPVPPPATAPTVRTSTSAAAGPAAVAPIGPPTRTTASGGPDLPALGTASAPQAGEPTATASAGSPSRPAAEPADTPAESPQTGAPAAERARPADAPAGSSRTGTPPASTPPRADAPPVPSPDTDPAPPPDTDPVPPPDEQPEPTARRRSAPVSAPPLGGTPGSSAPGRSAPRPVRAEGPSAPAPTGVSTAEDRAAVRALLGEHYRRCSGTVEQLSTRLPGLRFTAGDDITPDLAAVLLHHTEAGVPADRDGLVAAARSGDPRLAPFLRCLGSGLRRLPSHHGAVLLTAPPGSDRDDLLAQYRVGQQLTEPAPVTGLTATAAELPGSPVEFVIWSVTGRRTSAFAVGPEETRVTFPPATAFTVLDVLPADPADGPARVLLRECGGTDADPVGRDRDALTRLHSWLDRRDRLTTAERRTVEHPGRYHLTPGVELCPAPDPG